MKSHAEFVNGDINPRRYNVNLLYYSIYLHGIGVVLWSQVSYYTLAIWLIFIFLIFRILGIQNEVFMKRKIGKNLKVFVK